MSTQLATFGVCMVLGHPLAYVWVLAAQAAAVVAILAIATGQEVSLEHR
jgi:hypothetical protein